MQLRGRALAKGLATYVPVLRRFACTSSGGTVSARYCYAVWLRHGVMARAAAMPAVPVSVAELGPGDSIGIGLAAMLCGAQRYYALDAKPHANVERNLRVFEELLALFGARAPIPDETEFPNLFPPLASYAFPDAVAADGLDTGRIAAIRRAIRGENPGDDVQIHYLAPWERAVARLQGGIDMIYSQAVLEHVSDVPGCYRAMNRLLRTGGLMSHTIDFKSHGLTQDWYGHWTLGERTWRCVVGRRPYLINRLAWSDHRRYIEEAGFRIDAALARRAEPAPRHVLAQPFRRALTDDDLSTPGVFMQAIKA